jgi:hypothetical protein
VENPDRISHGIRELKLDGFEVGSSLIHFANRPGSKHEVHIVLGNHPVEPPQPSDEPVAVNLITSAS